MRRSLALLIIAVSALIAPRFARAEFACAKIHGLFDLNCDGIYKISFSGDSITYGLHDSFTPVKGYPGRLQLRWPWADVENMGIPGITSDGLLATFKQNLIKSRHTKIEMQSRHADIFVISVGVNDFFSANHSPSLTVTNISRIVQYIRTTLKKTDGSAPFVVVSTLTPTKRGYQRPFVDAVNSLLLHYAGTQNLPVYFRFDTLDVYHQSLLYLDGLHPDGTGYKEMTDIVQSTIKTKIQTAMAKIEPTASPTKSPTPTPIATETPVATPTP